MCRIDLSASQKAKKKRGICVEPFCVKRSKNRLRCSACARSRWAERNPEKYIFANLRGNARRRGKEFGLNFDEFKEWLHKEKYLDRIRGRNSCSVSVDRKKNDRGYFIDNLQTLTISANSEKMHYVDYFRNKYEQDSQTENAY